MNRSILIVALMTMLSACSASNMQSSIAKESSESLASHPKTYTATVELDNAGGISERDPKEVDMEKKCLSQGKTFKVVMILGDASKGETTKKDFTCEKAK